jgi:hypothetical protein
MIMPEEMQGSNAREHFQCNRASTQVVRRPQVVGPSRGLPQVPHVEEGPIRVTGMPRVLTSIAADGQAVPAPGRLEQVEVLARGAAGDAAPQPAALLGVPQLHLTLLT